MPKILVVDDEKVLVKGICFNLRSEGYEVDCGYDGEQAVEMAKATRYDLIVMDLMIGFLQIMITKQDFVFGLRKRIIRNMERNCKKNTMI